MAYLIRSDKGVLIATIGNVDAGKIIETDCGSWRTKTFVDSGKHNVFVLEGSGCYTLGNVKIHLFVDYYLIKE